MITQLQNAVQSYPESESVDVSSGHGNLVVRFLEFGFW